MVAAGPPPLSRQGSGRGNSSPWRSHCPSRFGTGRATASGRPFPATTVSKWSSPLVERISANPTSAQADRGIHPGSAWIHRDPPRHAHGASTSTWKPCSRAGIVWLRPGVSALPPGILFCRRRAVPFHKIRPPWPWTIFVYGHPMTVGSGPPAETAMRNSTHDPWRMRHALPGAAIRPPRQGHSCHHH